VPSVLDFVGLTESNVETVSDDAKEGKGQTNAIATTMTSMTSTVVSATTNSPPYTVLEIAALIFIPVGIVAASLGRASLWRLSRFNTPRLRDIIFGSKLDAVTWVQPIGYVTQMIYATGATIYITCFESTMDKVTNRDGTVTWKHGKMTFNSKNLFESLFGALCISLAGCLIMSPGITMGSVLGGRLIQRRMLINARKMQQQMTTASHSRSTI